MNELGNQLASAVLVSQLFELAKGYGFIISSDTAKHVKIILGFLTALITSIGISYTFDYDPGSGGQIIFHLPALHTIFDVAKQWAFQEYIYRTGIQDKTVIVKHELPSGLH